MSIKVLIGNRIAAARTALHLSQIELAALTGFGKTRISNWETGFRTPKLEESKILEKYLKVPAPYLLCLTDQKQLPPMNVIRNEFKTIPLFYENELLINVTTTNKQNKTKKYFPLMPQHESLREQNAFAFALFDNSMAPEFIETDIIVFVPNPQVRHNQLILVSLKDSQDIMFRRYYLDNSNRNAPVIKLIPSSPEWITHQVEHQTDLIILGVMSTRQRLFI